MSKVTVYYFKGYDIRTDEMIVSKAMATLEWIDQHQYTALLGTAKEVDASTLDTNGLYRQHK
jgi:hypothetical protein